MKNLKKPTIAVCASVSFYKYLPKIEAALKKNGFEVLLPDVARKMNRIKNFNVKK